LPSIKEDTWSWISVSLIQKMGKEESGDKRTHEVQTHEVITVVDRKRSMDRRSGPKVFTDSEIRKRRKHLAKVSKCGVVKEVGPRS
jgi:hypothetical protein